MARIPDARPGLIFRYSYLWVNDSRRGHGTAAKDRPACIVTQVKTGSDLTLRTVGRSRITLGDVIIMPITTRPPGADVITVEITPSEKRLCGLDQATPSWVIISEFNADTWPNADIVPVPKTGEFRYGMAPPSLLRRIALTFTDARREDRVLGVKR